jgi:hypothetical protein
MTEDINHPAPINRHNVGNESNINRTIEKIKINLIEDNIVFKK